MWELRTTMKRNTICPMEILVKEKDEMTESIVKH